MKSDQYNGNNKEERLNFYFDTVYIVFVGRIKKIV